MVGLYIRHLHSRSQSIEPVGRWLMYDYIKETYRFDAKVGDRVQHTITKKYGSIARENKSSGHYVQVRFDGGTFSLPCHPDELQHI